jgi:hypothetical protein
MSRSKDADLKTIYLVRNMERANQNLGCGTNIVVLHGRQFVIFGVFTAVRMMMMFFCILAPCRLVGRCQRFSPEAGDCMFLR